MRIFLTGACGYIGSVLLPKLRKAGHQVTTCDTGWFGGEPNIKCDIRTLKSLPVVDAIVHLANIANDPCGELDAKLTWEVNALGTVLLADMAVRAGIKRFIFASSASVYGLKDNEPVREETSLEPVSDYNKTKMVAERILLSYASKMNIQIVRPATVCGMSPRMRLDVIVNMLTMQALAKGEIMAHCGEHGAGLMRPHTHIEDMTDLYVWLLAHPEVTGVYNAGFENLSVAALAEKITQHVPATVKVTTVADKRSYCVDSSKLLLAGFRPRFSVDDAIANIAEAYSTGSLKDEDRCYNLRYMQQNGWVAA
jgi:nucleoside-diphosphate-sugar epimerase